MATSNSYTSVSRQTSYKISIVEIGEAANRFKSATDRHGNIIIYDRSANAVHTNGSTAFASGVSNLPDLSEIRAF